jgi:chemotaxis protein methyltransferase CheR
VVGMTDPYANLKFIGDGPEPMRRHPTQRVPRAVPQGTLGAAGEAFFEHLCSDWGLTAAYYRASILARRQGACLRALGASSPADGLAVLATDARRSERALGALMIGVTEFFRDPAAFLALGALLPLLKRPDRPLRVLSVGCSDGSELYSIAILLAEQGLLDGARLHGLDARPAAIRKARAGVYPAAAIDALAPARRGHFLPARARERWRDTSLPPGEIVRVADSLRSACTWTVADAFDLEFLGGGDHDLVLCRNLVIYLKNDAATRIWHLCAGQLRPGGLLMAGKAERAPPDLRGLLRSVGPCLYRKQPPP